MNNTHPFSRPSSHHLEPTAKNRNAPLQIRRLKMMGYYYGFRHTATCWPLTFIFFYLVSFFHVFVQESNIFKRCVRRENENLQRWRSEKVWGWVFGMMCLRQVLARKKSRAVTGSAGQASISHPRHSFPSALSRPPLLHAREWRTACEDMAEWGSEWSEWGRGTGEQVNYDRAAVPIKHFFFLFLILLFWESQKQRLSSWPKMMLGDMVTCSYCWHWHSDMSPHWILQWLISIVTVTCTSQWPFCPQHFVTHWPRYTAREALRDTTTRHCTDSGIPWQSDVDQFPILSPPSSPSLAIGVYDQYGSHVLPRVAGSRELLPKKTTSSREGKPDEDRCDCRWHGEV